MQLQEVNVDLIKIKDVYVLKEYAHITERERNLLFIDFRVLPIVGKKVPSTDIISGFVFTLQVEKTRNELMWNHMKDGTQSTYVKFLKNSLDAYYPSFYAMKNGETVKTDYKTWLDTHITLADSSQVSSERYHISQVIACMDMLHKYGVAPKDISIYTVSGEQDVT